MVIRIGRDCDPEFRITTALAQLRGDEIKGPVNLEVWAYSGKVGAEKTADLLVRYIKPHWRLFLWMDDSRLVDIPHSVWELANLEVLRLDRNKLRALSPAIAKLTKLRELSLGWNPIGNFPDAMCQLEQLESLSAYGCRLSVLPVPFASLRNLMTLNLNENAFAQFPEVIC